MLASFSSAADQWAYFGTYTKGESKGIYSASFDSGTGEVGEIRLAVELENPSFLVIHPNETVLYAVSEVKDSKGGGSVSAFKISRDTGELVFLNRQPTKGGAPCHASMDAKGQCLLVANYLGGNVISYSIDREGKISEPRSLIQHQGSSVNKRRQQEPHAHSINPGSGDRFAYAADLGADKVFVYRLNPEMGTLESSGAVSASPGAGPRHMAIHPGGKFVYAINELDLTVTAYRCNPDDGSLASFQKIGTLPENQENVGSTAEVRIHPNGKFLYGSNRGHNSIVVYRIDQEDGKLTKLQVESVRCEVPRNFNFDLSGKFLFAAGHKSNLVTLFNLNQETGLLEFTGTEFPVASPVCIKLVNRTKD